MKYDLQMKDNEVFEIDIENETLAAVKSAMALASKSEKTWREKALDIMASILSYHPKNDDELKQGYNEESKAMLYQLLVQTHPKWGDLVTLKTRHANETDESKKDALKHQLNGLKEEIRRLAGSIATRIYKYALDELTPDDKKSLTREAKSPRALAEDFLSKLQKVIDKPENWPDADVKLARDLVNGIRSALGSSGIAAPLFTSVAAPIAKPWEKPSDPVISKPAEALL